jgi:nucleoside-diphosphate-sugar epimerase
MKKALVSGGMGFIGQHLVQALRATGEWDVVIVDDLSTHEHPDSIPLLGFRRGRIQDILYSIPHDFDAVFHLAGKVGPTGVLNFSGMIAIDTIESADAMGFVAEQSDCPLIDISTSEVYGTPGESNTEDSPKVFRDASARSEYAVSKLAAEFMLLNRKNLDVRIVRPFNVAGPGQRVDGGFVLPRFVRQALADRDVTVYPPGTQERAFTHVDDIVDGILRVFKDGGPGEVYNLGNPANRCTILELAEAVVSEVGAGVIVMVDPQELHGAAFREAPDKIPNADKAMNELGWTPIYTTTDIVRDVIEDCLRT